MRGARPIGRTYTQHEAPFLNLTKSKHLHTKLSPVILACRDKALPLVQLTSNKKPPQTVQSLGGALQGSVDKTVALHNEIISDLLWLHKRGRTQISSYKRFLVRYIGF